MTTYTALTDAQMQAGEPLTQAKARALRDNLLAFLEGDSSVPLNVLAGSNLIVLNAQEASSSASIAFSSTLITSARKLYHIVVVNAMPATNGVGFEMHFSIDNGSNYEQGASDYPQAAPGLGSNGTTYNSISEGTTSLLLSNTGAAISSAASGGGWSGIITLSGLALTSVVKRASWRGEYYAGGAPNVVHVDGSGWGGSATLQGNAVNNVRLRMTSGNITSGYFYLLGLRTA